MTTDKEFASKFEEIKFRALATRAVKLSDLRGGDFYRIHTLDYTGKIMTVECQFKHIESSIYFRHNKSTGTGVYRFKPAPTNQFVAGSIVLHDLTLDEDDYKASWVAILIREATESERDAVLNSPDVDSTSILGSHHHTIPGHTHFIGGSSIAISGSSHSNIKIPTPNRVVFAGGSSGGFIGTSIPRWQVDKNGDLIASSGILQSNIVNTTISGGPVGMANKPSDGWLSISGIKKKIKSIF